MLQNYIQVAIMWQYSIPKHDHRPFSYAILKVYMQKGDALLFVDGNDARRQRPQQPRRAAHDDLSLRPALGRDTLRL